MLCPCCGKRATARTSEQLDHGIYQTYFRCNNEHCACVFKVISEVVHIIHQSKLPESIRKELPVSLRTNGIYKKQQRRRSKSYKRLIQDLFNEVTNKDVVSKY